jgi:hypothetical protein
MHAQRIRYAACVVALAMATCPAARAQPATGDGPMSAAAGAAASAWETVSTGASNLWTATTSMFGAPDPFDYLPEQMSGQDRGFLVLMDAAGYRLVGIDTGGGLFGSVRYRFAQERMPSAGDLDRVRRGLAAHEERFGGATAAAQHRALRGLLAIADTPGFQVAAVTLDVLPWPKVRFHLEPSGGAASPTSP